MQEPRSDDKDEKRRRRWKRKNWREKKINNKFWCAAFDPDSDLLHVAGKIENLSQALGHRDNFSRSPSRSTLQWKVAEGEEFTLILHVRKSRNSQAGESIGRNKQKKNAHKTCKNPPEIACFSNTGQRKLQCAASSKNTINFVSQNNFSIFLLRLFAFYEMNPTSESLINLLKAREPTRTFCNCATHVKLSKRLFFNRRKQKQKTLKISLQNCQHIDSLAYMFGHSMSELFFSLYSIIFYQFVLSQFNGFAI